MGTNQTCVGWAVSVLCVRLMGAGCIVGCADETASMGNHGWVSSERTTDEPTTGENTDRAAPSAESMVLAGDTSATPKPRPDADAATARSSDETSEGVSENRSGSETSFADAGLETSENAPSEEVEHATLVATSAAPDVDGGAASNGLICRDTAGLCDPVGECARVDCNHESTGKACAYTPSRMYPFMCVETAGYEPFRPCDLDDACAAGSVCISKVAILKDGSFYRRPGAVCRQTCREDLDCGEGEWCSQATDDNNEVIPDLRVCHRHCSTESDCYEGPGDEEVRCSNSVEGAPPSTFECSRYRAPLPMTETADALVTSNAVSEAQAAMASASESKGVSALPLQLSALLSASGCLFNEDCPEGRDCVSGACQQRCESPADCDSADCVVVAGRGVCGATCETAPGAECSVLPLDCGCEMGQTCQLGISLTPRCAQPGLNGAMSWCNTAEDCGSGLSCIAGLCRPLCAPEAKTCGANDGECLLAVSREDGNVYACGGNCDPLAGSDNGCGTGAVCLPGFDPNHHHQALCVSERPGQATKTLSQTCEADYDCAPGLGCDDRHTCQHWCRSSEDCPSTQDCRLDGSYLGQTLFRFGRSPEDTLGLCGNTF